MAYLIIGKTECFHQLLNVDKFEGMFMLILLKFLAAASELLICSLSTINHIKAINSSALLKNIFPFDLNKLILHQFCVHIFRGI